MSASCHTPRQFDGISQAYRRVLLIIIGINAGMFLVEVIASIYADSQALQADSLDFLGDSLTYTLSLWAIGKSANVRSNASIIKGISLLILACWVLLSTLYHMFIEPAPIASIMSGIAVMALIANLTSVLLLAKYQQGDSNVRSVWLCSRNDAIGNCLVLLAAGCIWLTGNHWPDLVVAFIMAGLFAHSAFQIIRQALQEKHPSDPCC
ncbi:MAG: cation transporter [Arenicella sp.]